jgi:hypothetical protein
MPQKTSISSPENLEKILRIPVDMDVDIHRMDNIHNMDSLGNITEWTGF